MTWPSTADSGAVGPTSDPERLGPSPSPGHDDTGYGQPAASGRLADETANQEEDATGCRERRGDVERCHARDPHSNRTVGAGPWRRVDSAHQRRRAGERGTPATVVHRDQDR